MNEKRHESKNTPSASEKVWKFGRDLNMLEAIAIGGIALAIPGPNQFLAAWAALNGAQAVGFEVLRKNSEKKRQRGGTGKNKNISLKALSKAAA